MNSVEISKKKKKKKKKIPQNAKKMHYFELKRQN